MLIGFLSNFTYLIKFLIEDTDFNIGPAQINPTVIHIFLLNNRTIIYEILKSSHVLLLAMINSHYISIFEGIVYSDYQ